MSMNTEEAETGISKSEHIQYFLEMLVDVTFNVKGLCFGACGYLAEQ
jgi:hypothetical protein